MIPKFRAYHVKFGMIHVNWIEFTLDTTDKNSYPFLLGGGTTQDRRLIKECRINPEKLMQSTGLKDKNGVEIFEGDIIQTVSEVGTRLSKFLVHRNIVDSGFVKTREDGKYFKLDLVSGCSKEIIGNIHENPEILIIRK